MHYHALFQCGTIRTVEPGALSLQGGRRNSRQSSLNLASGQAWKCLTPKYPKRPSACKSGLPNGVEFTGLANSCRPYEMAGHFPCEQDLWVLSCQGSPLFVDLPEIACRSFSATPRGSCRQACDVGQGTCSLECPRHLNWLFNFQGWRRAHTVSAN